MLMMGNQKRSTLATNKYHAPIVLESLAAGIYLCYQTDQGRFGQFQYDEYISDTVTINITYNTWALP